MSFPSVQQAPVFTPATSSMPRQTAYIQQGQCGNCGVTLIPYPQTQLNQGASDQYQMSAQEKMQSSGGTLQDSHQFSPAPGQSYVGGKGGQQEAEATPEDIQSQYGSEYGEPEAGKPAAEASTAKAGFDFAAFLSPLNPEERAAEAAKARESASLPEEQRQIDQAQSDESSFEHIESGYSPQESEQIQDGGGYSQGATMESGQVQTGTHGQSEQVQSPHTRAGSVAPGQTGQISSLSGGHQPQMMGQIQGSGGQSQGATLQPGQSGQVQTGSHGQSGQVQPPHTQAGSVAPDQTGQTSPLSGLDASAVQQTAQQHASASAGGQLVNQSSQRTSMEDSLLSTKNVYNAMGELDRGIQEIQLSAIDDILQHHIQTVALAHQQRIFLDTHGVSVDEHLAGVQQKHPETTKGTVKSK